MKKILLVMAIITLMIVVTGTVCAEKQINMGPSGGNGGGEFRDNVPSGSEAVEVNIRSGAYIDSLQMVVQLPNGKIRYLGKHGGDGGGKDTLTLRDGEYITAVSGRYGAYVDSIQFSTNFRESPTYGGSGGGQDFYYEAPPGWQIVGFFGRSGAYIDAIGVIVTKRPVAS